MVIWYDLTPKMDVMIDTVSSYPFEEVDLRFRDDVLAEVDKVFTLKESPVLGTSLLYHLLKGLICVSEYIIGD